MDEEVYKSRDKRQTVAADRIFPFQLAQLFRVIPIEEGYIDVERHSKCPQGICGQEPRLLVRENHCKLIATMNLNRRQMEALNLLTNGSKRLEIGKVGYPRQLGYPTEISSWLY